MPASPLFRVATRKSALAIRQAEWVVARAQAASPKARFELAPMTSAGDEELSRPLADIGGKDLFVKNLERAMLEGHADFAVHSLKDMGTDTPPPFVIAAVCGAQDERDALVLRSGVEMDALSRAVIGTSSPRRRALLLQKYPHAKIKPARGDLGTRLKKLENGEFDALVLAAAGLLRLGWEEKISHLFSPAEFFPAVGQGLLAVECLKENESAVTLLEKINDEDAARKAEAGRAFAAALGGDCHTPLGAHIVLQNEKTTVSGFLAVHEKMLTARAEDASPRAAGKKAAALILARA